MKVVAVMNQKGGVGKTTTCVTLGHGLALRGYRTLLVDLDAQGNVSDSLGLEKCSGLYRLLIDSVGEAAIVRSGRENLEVVASDHSTAKARQILAGMNFREQVLSRAVKGIVGYDVALLDVAPGMDLLQVSALVAADAFLVPIALDHLALVGASDLLNAARALRQAGGFSARFLGVLPTFWERTTNESHEQLRILHQQFQRLVWPPIPRDTKCREAAAHGQTLYEYAPDCRALAGVQLSGSIKIAGGYRQVLARLVQEVGW